MLTKEQNRTRKVQDRAPVRIDALTNKLATICGEVVAIKNSPESAGHRKLTSLEQALVNLTLQVKQSTQDIVDARLLLADTVSMTLEEKLLITKMRVQQWYEHHGGQVFVAFSGGKDSTVLLHIVRSLYPDVKAVFCNTGLEYPELVEFAESFPNVVTVRPAKSFVKVLKEDGYPISNKRTAKAISKLQHPTKRNFLSRRLALTGYVARDGVFQSRSKISKKWFHIPWSDINATDKCCDHLKKNPTARWQKENPGYKPFIGTMMGEGITRDSMMKKRTCNVFDGSNPSSMPLKFWSDEDLWEYVKINSVKICSVYKDFNLKRTGCTFCAYGAEFEPGDDNRFTKLKESHPKQFNAFIHKFGMNKALDYAGINYGEEPTHTAPVIPSYTCHSCNKEFSLHAVAFATERAWAQAEEVSKPPTAGMDLFCRACAISEGLPVAKK